MKLNVSSFPILIIPIHMWVVRKCCFFFFSFFLFRKELFSFDVSNWAILLIKVFINQNNWSFPFYFVLNIICFIIGLGKWRFWDSGSDSGTNCKWPTRFVEKLLLIDTYISQETWFTWFAYFLNIHFDYSKSIEMANELLFNICYGWAPCSMRHEEWAEHWNK